MSEFALFIQVLEISVQRNGADKPLTLGHLLNITKMVQKKLEQEDITLQKAFDEIMMNHLNN